MLSPCAPFPDESPGCVNNVGIKKPASNRLIPAWGMKYGDGYIVPGTCGFSITVAKIHKPGASKSFGVNCRYCSTGVFHAQVIPESDFMHRFAIALLATAAIVGISVSASAADLPRKAPAYIPPAPLPYNWTGFYVGLNAGGSWGRQTNSLESAITG